MTCLDLTEWDPWGWAREPEEGEAAERAFLAVGAVVWAWAEDGASAAVVVEVFGWDLGAAVPREAEHTAPANGGIGGESTFTG